MDVLNVDLLLKILVAHFLSDFILQPTKWATEKDKHGFKSWHLYIHVIITAATLFIFLWDFKLWGLVLIISLLHFIIDLIKSSLQRTNIWIFVTDQLFHFLIIITVWLVYTNQSEKFFDLLSSFINNPTFWWLFLAYTLLTIPTSVLIGKMTNKWSNELIWFKYNKRLRKCMKVDRNNRTSPNFYIYYCKSINCNWVFTCCKISLPLWRLKRFYRSKKD